MPSKELPEFFPAECRAECFVCGSRLLASSEAHSPTLEHLIPQWMIREFGLSHATITLRPGITIRYHNYLMPCCHECNCSLLAPVEEAIKADLLGSSVGSMPVEAYCVWACKILTGAHLYEYAIARAFEGIPPAECSERIPQAELYRSYFKLLRGQARFRDESGSFPFSLLHFKTKVDSRKSARFDFQLYPCIDALYLRLAHRSLLCRFDGGHVRRHGGHFFEPYFCECLAPLQMEELASHFFTMADRQSRPVSFIKTDNEGYERFLYLSNRQGFIERDDFSDLADWLARCTRCPREVFTPDGRCIRTFLVDNDGRFLDVPVNATAC